MNKTHKAYKNGTCGSCLSFSFLAKSSLALPPEAKRKGGTRKAVPTYVEHQRYRKLLGQKGMAEAWQRLMQRTCRQAGDDTDLAGSELTLEILYALQKEAQENARRARSKLDDFLRAGQLHE